MKNASFKSNIQEWLLSEGWLVGDYRGLDNVKWALSVTDMNNHKLLVFQAIAAPVIVIQGAITIDEEVSKRLEELNQYERNGFYMELEYSLLQINVENRGIQEPLKMIIVTQRIYNDDLTRDAFIQRLLSVCNATNIAFLLINSLMSATVPNKFSGKPMGFMHREKKEEEQTKTNPNEVK